MERLAADQQREWIGRQALDGNPSTHAAGRGEPAVAAGGVRVRVDAVEFLGELQRDVEPLSAVPEGAEVFFSPAHAGSAYAEANAGRWQSAQVRMAGEREAGLARAERDAGRMERFGERFGHWAGERFPREPGPSSVPVAGGGGPDHRSGDDPALSASAAGVSGETLDGVFESAKRRVGQNLDDGGGLDGLDTDEGLHSYLDGLWVGAHAVTEAGRVLREVFSRWRVSLAPGERVWLDGGPGPGPAPGAGPAARGMALPGVLVGGPAQAGPVVGRRPQSGVPRVVPVVRGVGVLAGSVDGVSGGGGPGPGSVGGRAGQSGQGGLWPRDEGGGGSGGRERWPDGDGVAGGGNGGGEGSVPERVPGEEAPAGRVLRAATEVFERVVRREVEVLLTPAALSAGPRRLMGEITRAVDLVFLGGREVRESPAAVPEVRRGVERVVRRLGSRLPEAGRVFERAVADERARQRAADRFEAAVGQHTGGPAGPARLRDVASPRGGPGWQLSEGGRERLRREWMAEAEADRREIFGEPGVPTGP
ncbi:hypothetical protein ACWEMN_53845, partial [Streptomyces mirabilis]